MRKYFGFVCLILAIIPCAVMGDTVVKVSGQVRFRSEMDKRSLDTLAVSITPSYGRVRVGIEAVVDSNVLAFVQVQDSRMFGARNPGGELMSGTTANGSNVDLHQGYLELPRLIGQRIGLKLGRFEVAWNNERLMGAVDWNNVGRSWEGGVAWYHGDKFAFDLYALDADRTFGISSERSYSVVGALVSFKQHATELFLIDDWVLWKFGRRSVSRSRSTAGLYTKQVSRYFDLEFTGAYQWGTAPAGRKVNAFMIQSEAGYSLASTGNIRTAAGIDYSSGDNHPFDRLEKGFDNLYYLGHKFRGYMDYFSDTYSTRGLGLIDIYGRARFEPARGWKTGADIHYFHSAADDNALYSWNHVRIKDIGCEIDVVANTARVKGAVLDGGFSVFLASDGFAQSASIFAGQRDHDLGYWGYFQATVNF